MFECYAYDTGFFHPVDRKIAIKLLIKQFRPYRFQELPTNQNLATFTLSKITKEGLVLDCKIDTNPRHVQPAVGRIYAIKDNSKGIQRDTLQ
jgi:hypothetical protein